MFGLKKEPQTLSMFKDFDKNRESFKKLFEKVKDHKICTIAITGSRNSGKSFFLNYCLRFLYANVSFINF